MSWSIRSPSLSSLNRNVTIPIHSHLIILREDAYTMADVQCVTCGQAGETITDPLFMGKLESEIKAKVCKPCWKKWEGMRVMVINEYQVNLGEESGRDLVKKQMKAFLKLGEQTDTGKLDQNYRPPA
jgi:Fe-S cluster biosynthesis and repair protein YggX